MRYARSWRKKRGANTERTTRISNVLSVLIGSITARVSRGSSALTAMLKKWDSATVPAGTRATPDNGCPRFITAPAGPGEKKGSSVMSDNPLFLTVECLEKMDPHTVFATGIIADSPDGLFMTGSGQDLRWVAYRGGFPDWYIYCHWSDKSVEWVARRGDKVHNRQNILRVVQASEEALRRYRH